MVKLFILKTETVFMLTCVDVHDMHYLIKNISIVLIILSENCGLNRYADQMKHTPVVNYYKY